MQEKLFIGIDLGTSGVKIILVAHDGRIIKEVNKTYQLYYPQEGWSEQNPLDWWNNTVEGLKELLTDAKRSQVAGISFSGQMHGLVMLDAVGEVIRPAILWNDGRTTSEVSYLNEQIGEKTLVKYTGNIAFAGFTAPKIMWVKHHESANFNRLAMMMLPKDYLVYQMSGVYGSDYSDAAGTLLLDVEHKRWSSEMCEIVGISVDILPPLHESYDKVGVIKPELAHMLDLPLTTAIIAGASDNAAAAIGTGCVSDNDCTISLGTSGTVIVAKDDYLSTDTAPFHSFNHASGKYYLMGCILSAASANKWWIEDILNSTYSAEKVDINQYIDNKTYFLPYLMGERCPYNNVNARGAFIGMRASTTKAEMNLAVLEGVAFALKDCLSLITKTSPKPQRAVLCGGGAKNPSWAEVIANVLNLPLVFVQNEQGPSYGAAILAMVGTGAFASIEEACRTLLKEQSPILPKATLAEHYLAKYEQYKKLYQALETTFNNWI